MSTRPVSHEDAVSAKKNLSWILALAVVTAVFAMSTVWFLDSRSTPTIIFLATPRSDIAVEIRGAISTPGVVFVDPGDRLIDVVNASGGMTSDADAPLVNLSARVGDGQMIVIPTRVPASIESTGDVSGLVNLNTASIEDLKQLPGIGDVLAQRIVAYREFNGPILSVDDLTDIEGISPSLVDGIRDLVTVSSND